MNLYGAYEGFRDSRTGKRYRTFAEYWAATWRERVRLIQKFQKGMRKTMHELAKLREAAR